MAAKKKAEAAIHAMAEALAEPDAEAAPADVPAEPELPAEEVPAEDPEPAPDTQLDDRALSAARTARINGTGLDGTGGTVMLGFGPDAAARGATLAVASRPAEETE